MMNIVSGVRLIRIAYDSLQECQGGTEKLDFVERCGAESLVAFVHHNVLTPLNFDMDLDRLTLSELEQLYVAITESYHMVLWINSNFNFLGQYLSKFEGLIERIHTYELLATSSSHAMR
jgi:hypothetical protein